MATVLMPGDIHHADTSPEERAEKFFHRFHYEKDWPHGVRAVYIHRPVEQEDDITPLASQPTALIEEINEYDKIYMNVPYPKREFNPADEGKTITPIPTHTLTDRPTNAMGFIDYEDKRKRAGGDKFAQSFSEMLDRQNANKQRASEAVPDMRWPAGHAPQPVSTDRVISNSSEAKSDTRW
eukprot:GILJ01027139.1.p1 GENE.GILJ01027139.1~~GILJ01027139.1.p1  ORF type:complete len:212 (+),score=30.20 GILJ01027139.1:96-638(+)